METIYVEDPRIERRYLELARMSRKLGIPTLEAFLQLDVAMPGGKVIYSAKQRSHSWVRNGYNTLYSGIGALNASDGSPNWGGGYLNIKNTGGSIVSQAGGICQPSGGVPQSLHVSGYGYTAAAGDTSIGIVVGSGTNAETFEDYALQSLIAHGTGAGQLSYSASEAPARSYDPGTKTMSTAYVRYMNNNGVGSVSVNEVAIIMKMYIGAFVTSRDKLGSTVVVASAGQLKVTYTVSLVYPA